jgi:hypothetical protein
MPWASCAKRGEKNNRSGLLPTASAVKGQFIDRSALHLVFSAPIASIKYRDDYYNFNRDQPPLWMVQNRVQPVHKDSPGGQDCMPA